LHPNLRHGGRLPVKSLEKASEGGDISYYLALSVADETGRISGESHPERIARNEPPIEERPKKGRGMPIETRLGAGAIDDPADRPLHDRG
jgi:hypothetical protein